MTTAVAPDDLLVELRSARAARLDADDIPGDWTNRQRQDYLTQTQTLDRHITGIVSALEFIASREARRAPLLAVQKRYTKVAKQLRTRQDETTDARTRSALEQSLHALEHGVQHVMAEPLLPGPLRELLTDTCKTCGHRTLQWHGALARIESDIAKYEAQIAEQQRLLDAHRRGAEATLELGRRESSDAS